MNFQSFVDDLVCGLVRVVEDGKAGEIYNFAGGDDEWANIDTVRTLCAHLNKCRPAERPYETNIDFVTDSPSQDARYAISYDKVGKLSGWQPNEKLSEGLEATIDWCLGNTEWWQSILSGGYSAERIGQSAP